MTQIELLNKIRAEIKRRKGYISVTHFAEELLSFIDTLSKEPVCLYDGEAPSKQKCGDCTIACSVRVEEEPNKDLEEEINRYLEPIHAADIQFEPFTQMTKCARHFAKWGADHLRDSTKMVDNDLEKELESFMKENIPYGQGGYGDMMRIARHFAEWGAEHLKK